MANETHEVDNDDIDEMITAYFADNMPNTGLFVCIKTLKDGAYSISQEFGSAVEVEIEDYIVGSSARMLSREDMFILLGRLNWTYKDEVRRQILAMDGRKEAQ